MEKSIETVMHLGVDFWEAKLLRSHEKIKEIQVISETHSKTPPSGSKVTNMAPSWLPKRSQTRRKIDGKTIENVIHLGIDFWKDLCGFWIEKSFKIEEKSIEKARRLGIYF